MDVLTGWGLQGKHSKLILARKNTQSPDFYIFILQLFPWLFFLHQHPTTTLDQLSTTDLCELHTVNRKELFSPELSHIGTLWFLWRLSFVSYSLQLKSTHPGPLVPVFQIRRERMVKHSPTIYLSKTIKMKYVAEIVTKNVRALAMCSLCSQSILKCVPSSMHLVEASVKNLFVKLIWTNSWRNLKTLQYKLNLIWPIFFFFPKGIHDSVLIMSSVVVILIKLISTCSNIPDYSHKNLWRWMLSIFVVKEILEQTG